MQTFVYADNFRGFTDAVIPVTQVNFLVGENSTGKTSFIELIETFSNMSFWAFQPNFGVIGAQQRHFLDLVSAASRSKAQFCIGAIELSETEPAKDFGMLVTYKNLDGRPAPTRVSMLQGQKLRTVDGRLWRSKAGDPYKARVHAHTNVASLDLQARMAEYVRAHHSNAAFGIRQVTEEREANPLFLRFDEVLFDGKSLEQRDLRAPYPFMSNFVELAPIRTRPKRTYDAPQTDFSPEGEHTPYVIRRRLTSKTQAEAFKSFIERAGASSGLFKSISVKSYGRNPTAPFEMKVVLDSVSFGLENVGYGVSQSLPVLVEMFVRGKRATFAIQQPEVHLHPRAQATFGELIAELARQDEKRFFVETHSDFTIDRFRLNVRKEGYVPSQLLFFQRLENRNSVTPIPILENGDLSAGQPPEYRDFFFNESLSLLA